MSFCAMLLHRVAMGPEVCPTPSVCLRRQPRDAQPGADRFGASLCAVVRFGRIGTAYRSSAHAADGGSSTRHRGAHRITNPMLPTSNAYVPPLTDAFRSHLPSHLPFHCPWGSPLDGSEAVSGQRALVRID